MLFNNLLYVIFSDKYLQSALSPAIFGGLYNLTHSIIWECLEVLVKSDSFFVFVFEKFKKIILKFKNCHIQAFLRTKTRQSFMSDSLCD